MRIQEVSWEATPAPGPNAYMALLVKETVTLHKVLTKYLAAPAVEVRPPGAPARVCT